MCRGPRILVRLHVGMIYFRIEPVINARRLSQSYAAGALSVRAHDFGGAAGLAFSNKWPLVCLASVRSSAFG
jgi:hypothetical protein